MCFKASDCDGQELKQLFQDAIDFIHKARLNNQNVLVHCLAGISRSVTIVIAYIMTLVEVFSFIFILNLNINRTFFKDTFQ